MSHLGTMDTKSSHSEDPEFYSAEELEAHRRRVAELRAKARTLIQEAGITVHPRLAAQRTS